MSEREWNSVLSIARLAPNTGMVPVKSFVLLAVQAEIDRLRAALARSGQAASGSSQGARSDERTGWPPGLLQDDSRELSRALASKPDAMVHARDAVAKIGQPEAPTAAPLERDAHRGGSSYEASMLRDLLARIHRDGGHYVEAHGLDKAIDDAHVLSASRISALEMLVEAKRAKDAGDHARHDFLKPLAWAAAFAVVERSGAHPPARSGAGSEEAQPDRSEGA